MDLKFSESIELVAWTYPEIMKAIRQVKVDQQAPNLDFRWIWSDLVLCEVPFAPFVHLPLEQKSLFFIR